MIVHTAALKHGIDPDDAVYAAQHSVYRAAETDEHPVSDFRLGFDPHGRLLELTVLVFDSGNEMLIHAMKARKQYLGLLP